MLNGGDAGRASCAALDPAGGMEVLLAALRQAAAARPRPRAGEPTPRARVGGPPANDRPGKAHRHSYPMSVGSRRCVLDFLLLLCNKILVFKMEKI